MDGVSLGEEFDAKVVDARCKSGLSSFVFPEACCKFHWMVAKRSKFLYKLFESDEPSLFQTVHALAYFEVDVAAGFNCELVLFLDFVRDKFVVHA